MDFAFDQKSYLDKCDLIDILRSMGKEEGNEEIGE
jgi:hypothetical protein